MSNERLRAAITSAGYDVTSFADQLQVDRKTVERWITTDRVPHRLHRIAAASHLSKSDGYLWPSTLSDPAALAAAQAELVKIYPSRGSVPLDVWTNLIDTAAKNIDILVYAGSFLHDGLPAFTDRMANRAQAGVKIRIMIGDPNSTAVALRGQEEGIGNLMAARCQLSLTYLQTVSSPGIEVRCHGTTLYASIFRFDEAVLINSHVFGSPASQSPLLHIIKVAGGRLFDHYTRSLDQVWETSTPSGDGAWSGNASSGTSSRTATYALANDGL